ncbi:putative amino acid transporter [Mycena albidolilacea]|uniref:Amino acid transporter n=1 Tax=Mycena albidolilacea TaxID=1033008 RepID=A0AAD6ZVG8_9AGAR|nr:putative amino acid transporter [Mycena albidolilacea]
MAQPANLALEGGDPRLQHEKINEKVDADTPSPASPARGGIPPHARGLHDPDITFEEYYYYAQLTRAEEDSQTVTGYETNLLSLVFPPKSQGGVVKEKSASSDPVISDEEWTNASRALRTATRGAAFYLITTDILGPFGLPYAFATMGWGPGVALYTVFAGLAGYSGYLLWDIFLGLDSYQFPVLSFGDLGYRLYGPYMRYLFNFLQGIQLLLNVGIIVISNGEALSQATKFKLCFIVCCLIWAIVGFFMGQIRTLQKFGWLANVAVWINLICMFITMGAAAHTAPNFAGAGASAGATIAGGALVTPNAQGVFPPVQTSGGIPDTGSFVASVSGAMQAIFAYGGSMVFPEFMAEMRRPKDFLTAMWAAQAFIYFWYMFYGLFMYGFQGQYVINPSYLGIGPYNLQTAGNVFAMMSAVIAAALYGNIGIKVIYNNVFVEVFRAPGLNTTAGKWAWACLIPLYWAIAFVLAAGIPNFAGLTSVVAAFCILHFTYTFPPMLSVMFWMKRHALQEGEGYDPTTGQTVRHDSGFKRMVRGFMARRWWVNVANIIYMLGALALGGLGAYSSIIVLMDAFKSNRTTSFVCKSPLDG